VRSGLDTANPFEVMTFMECGVLVLVLVDAHSVVHYCGVARVLDKAFLARFVVACGRQPVSTVTIDLPTKT
jgi:hypothetical protein